MGRSTTDVEDKVTKLHPRLRGYCYKLKMSYLPLAMAWQVDDVYQECLFTIYKGLHKFVDDSNENSLLRWCMRCARNTVINLKDKERLAISSFDIDEIESDVVPCQNQNAQWEADYQLTLFSKLISPSQLSMVRLRYQGYMYEEIALILNTPTGTVKSRVNGAKQLLSAVCGVKKINH